MHLSPPCTEYSIALANRPRRLEEADRLVQRALQILEYARPRWWTLENPDGLLKTRPCMQPLAQYMQRVCYCKYSEGNPRWSYKKADMHLDQPGRLDAPTHVLQDVSLRVGPVPTRKTRDKG